MRYIKAAFQIFRNYDGQGGAFGDTAVAAAPADLGKASVFAASDSRHRGTLTILVINKTQHAIFDGKIAIKGGPFATAKVFGFNAASPKIRALTDAELKNDQLAYRLPPLSATLFVCSGR
jgi:hypothetical protein